MMDTRAELSDRRARARAQGGRRVRLGECGAGARREGGTRHAPELELGREGGRGVTRGHARARAHVLVLVVALETEEHGADEEGEHRVHHEAHHHDPRIAQDLAPIPVQQHGQPDGPDRARARRRDDVVLREVSRLEVRERLHLGERALPLHHRRRLRAQRVRRPLLHLHLPPLDQHGGVSVVGEVLVDQPEDEVRRVGHRWAWIAKLGEVVDDVHARTPEVDDAAVHHEANLRAPAAAAVAARPERVRMRACERRAPSAACGRRRPPVARARREPAR